MSDKNEWAASIAQAAEQIANDVKHGIVPIMSNELTATAFALMCVASGGEKGADEDAIGLMAEQVINAQTTLSLVRLIYEGAITPVIIDNKLAFGRGVRFDQCSDQYSNLIDAFKKQTGL